MADTVKIRAIRPMRYATRRLLPGDTMDDVPMKHARIFFLTKKAELVRAPSPLPPPPAEVVAAVTAAPVDDMPALRAEYERVIGRRPFFGWGADELRRRIAAGPDA